MFRSPTEIQITFFLLHIEGDVVATVKQLLIQLSSNCGTLESAFFHSVLIIPLKMIGFTMDSTADKIKMSLGFSKFSNK